MKAVFYVLGLCAITIFITGCKMINCNSSKCEPAGRCHCPCINSSNPEHGKEISQDDMKKVYQFIKDADHYYIATLDELQPRVRPFGTIHIFENKLYIQTGRSKKVGQQLEKCGRVELCAKKGDQWIRVSGLLVDDKRAEAKESLLNEYPSLKKMYSAADENTMVLFFRPGTAVATIYSFSGEPVTYYF